VQALGLRFFLPFDASQSIARRFSKLPTTKILFPVVARKATFQCGEHGANGKNKVQEKTRENQGNQEKQRSEAVHTGSIAHPSTTVCDWTANSI
jgi:hypothetical protein